MAQIVQATHEPESVIALTQTQLETVEYKSFFKTIDNPRCKYPTRLDTYGCGCVFDCGYCYAKWQLGFRKHWYPLNPKVADIEKIRKKIEKLPPGFIVRLGGMTDCFQPLELKTGVTLETIELLNKHRIGYLIVTKSPLIAYPYFIKAMDRELAHIQVSVTCLNSEMAKTYEGARPAEERIKAVLTLQKQGFDVAIRLSPLIEELMDFDTINSLGIDRCIVEFLRINGMQMKLPAMDYSKYTLYYGNCRHLPLDEKIRILSKVKIPTISVCEKVPEHYDYWQQNFNPNPADCCNLRIPIPTAVSNGA